VGFACGSSLEEKEEEGQRQKEWFDGDANGRYTSICSRKRCEQQGGAGR
jgi:hypothetical protein